jgi:CRP/FNR family transcriptional regulator
LPSILEDVDSNKIINRFTKKQLIFHEGNETYGIYFIQSGIVKVFKQGAFNKDQIVRISLVGDILGHRGFSSSNIYPVSAETITDSEICYFSKEYFFSLLDKMPQLAIGLMLFYANELNQEESKLRDMAIFNVREKVAKALLIFIDKFGLNENNEINNIEILSRQDLSESVGLTPNQVTKVLSELKQDRIIETTGKKITILNKENLEDIIAL